ncbi:hypothetical protein N825_17955 [Skermanella stibiiresistens SB22]|uniref:Cell wall hydrolase SleB domain-containing protein n=1 Tax=Skermanella stibiiresistens SB22 TaxID=1385369 RepID=W9GXZ4_9PROT|nr:cell wall hydrolase [Skermanella stibiiresistens]EWY37496.1 hypothetical protein N825_17955 [Skermanella stibiiresistens SB22]
MSRRRLVPVATPTPVAEAAGADAGTIDILARTLWGEARTETLRGIEAVAAVVLNRAALAPGVPLAAICRLFPCWGAEYPDRLKLATIQPAGRGAPGSTDALLFATCLRIARRAAAGLLDDPTGGATRYHESSILPDWTAGLSVRAEIGDRLFYRDEATGVTGWPA